MTDASLADFNKSFGGMLVLLVQQTALSNRELSACLTLSIGRPSMFDHTDVRINIP